MSAEEDEEDVERVLSGDLSAFEGVVRRWQRPIVNLAFRFFRNRERAEEMAQEAFLCAYRSLSKWRKEAAFSTWLFAIATNVYRNEFRRFRQVTVSLDDIPELLDSRTFAAKVEERDQSRIVRQAVLSLPLKYREALILYYFHDMDIPATARSLRVPEGTVKARLARGRGILRNKLAKTLSKLDLKEA
jgi:RNA polymerase sigma-70 factor, ECF subfamily